MSQETPVTRHAGERLMVVGGVITGLGMVLTLIAMLPLLHSATQLPSYFWGLAMVTGIGLAVLLVGFWRAARGRSKRIRAAAAEFDRSRRVSN